MSFNIGGYTANCNAARHWINRAVICSHILHRYEPDILGFQEVQQQNRAALDEDLMQYASEYGAKTCQQTDEGTMYNPIYWKPERFEELDTGMFYLSETPERWSKAWDAMHVRSATWVRLSCRQTDIAFIYVNTHLDHFGSQARIESSRLIVSRLMQLRHADNLPVIISGDFNARAWSPPNENVNDYPAPVAPHLLPAGGTVLHIFTEKLFKDAYVEAGQCNQIQMNTYHDYYGDAFPPAALRIDWILTLDGKYQIQTQKYRSIRDASPPIYASDHYPILAELAFGREQPDHLANTVRSTRV
jgi:endonuclease/exonuclease/phosphatase family metal-dependent hydrolase